MRQFDRRTLLMGVPAALASCGHESPYFGNTEPPSRQQLTCAMTASSIVLDPALAGAGWFDLRYDSMLANATATLDPGLRMQRQTECERYRLRAMPFMPLYHDVWAYPQKPYVRGITPNAMDAHPLKYAWIDTKWRAS